jgi:hypothetical protein
MQTDKRLDGLEAKGVRVDKMVSRDIGRMEEKREKRTKKREGNQHAATGEASKQSL